MKLKIVRFVLVFAVLAVFLWALAGTAYAGVMEKVGGWITGEVLALVLSALAAILAGVLGVLYKKITVTLIEAGEFMTVLGTSLQDGKLSKEEIAAILKEGRDVFNLWRKTPARYRARRE